uniref:UDENN domain-containing protein n=1 Tax=Chromera velia CCMP2878 TaxID=1169474 RepID=A0A0G4FXC1_9ALVE|eukprot:Cvel_3834.t1-p1 / transcript=Cvel_3834.t1 / gene=Cvel_3834 / organism=Chromera_velia_CCMP2878 / gene_product=Myotubularin-related protein 13, putative / transcript_product=Myotubularin-related protein 13, putative / location=Cvel_scaffold162:30502-41783(+) / protein_length=2063 / sequence_SO=supercontig / SO=protein_coding / is_pseudo=false
MKSAKNNCATVVDAFLVIGMPDLHTGRPPPRVSDWGQEGSSGSQEESEEDWVLGATYPVTVLQQFSSSDLLQRAFGCGGEGTTRSDGEEGAEIPQGVEAFCFPTGGANLRIAKFSPPPTFHTFVLTDQSANRLYGSCLIVQEDLYGDICPPGCEKKGPSKGHPPPLPPGLSPDIILTEPPAPVGEEEKFWVPKALCLLSRWPFFAVFYRFLYHLYRKSISANDAGIEGAVVALLAETPVPPPGGLEVHFRVGDVSLALSRPAVNQLPLLQVPVDVLFDRLTVESVVSLWSAVLLERRVALVSAHASVVTAACEVIRSLLFPLKLVTVYIPLLPSHLIDMCASPVPFLFGILNTSPSVKEQAASLCPGLLICDLDAGRLEVARPSAVRISMTSGRSDKHSAIPPLPDRPRSKLIMRVQAVIKQTGVGSPIVGGGGQQRQQQQQQQQQQQRASAGAGGGPRGLPHFQSENSHLPKTPRTVASSNTFRSRLSSSVFAGSGGGLAASSAPLSSAASHAPSHGPAAMMGLKRLQSLESPGADFTTSEAGTGREAASAQLRAAVGEGLDPSGIFRGGGGQFTPCDSGRAGSVCGERENFGSGASTVMEGSGVALGPWELLPFGGGEGASSGGDVESRRGSMVSVPFSWGSDPSSPDLAFSPLGLYWQLSECFVFRRGEGGERLVDAEKQEKRSLYLTKQEGIRQAFFQFFVATLQLFDHFQRKDREGFFAKEEFVQENPETFRPFLNELINTQSFTLFCTERWENASQESSMVTLLFRESVIAKRNRSKLKIQKEPTPFLNLVDVRENSNKKEQAKGYEVVPYGRSQSGLAGMPVVDLEDWMNSAEMKSERIPFRIFDWNIQLPQRPLPDLTRESRTLAALLESRTRRPGLEPQGAAVGAGAVGGFGGGIPDEITAVHFLWLYAFISCIGESASAYEENLRIDLVLSVVSAVVRAKKRFDSHILSYLVGTCAETGRPDAAMRLLEWVRAADVLADPALVVVLIERFACVASLRPPEKNQRARGAAGEEEESAMARSRSVHPGAATGAGKRGGIVLDIDKERVARELRQILARRRLMSPEWRLSPEVIGLHQRGGASLSELSESDSFGTFLKVVMSDALLDVDALCLFCNRSHPVALLYRKWREVAQSIGEGSKGGHVGDDSRSDTRQQPAFAESFLGALAKGGRTPQLLSILECDRCQRELRPKLKVVSRGPSSVNLQQATGASHPGREGGRRDPAEESVRVEVEYDLLSPYACLLEFLDNGNESGQKSFESAADLLDSDPSFFFSVLWHFILFDLAWEFLIPIAPSFPHLVPPDPSHSHTTPQAQAQAEAEGPNLTESPELKPGVPQQKERDSLGPPSPYPGPSPASTTNSPVFVPSPQPPLDPLATTPVPQISPDYFPSKYDDTSASASEEEDGEGENIALPHSASAPAIGESPPRRALRSQTQQEGTRTSRLRTRRMPTVLLANLLKEQENEKERENGENDEEKSQEREGGATEDKGEGKETNGLLNPSPSVPILPRSNSKPESGHSRTRSRGFLSKSFGPRRSDSANSPSAPRQVSSFDGGPLGSSMTTVLHERQQRASGSWENTGDAQGEGKEREGRKASGGGALGVIEGLFSTLKGGKGGKGRRESAPATGERGGIQRDVQDVVERGGVGESEGGKTGSRKRNYSVGGFEGSFGGTSGGLRDLLWPDSDSESEQSLSSSAQQTCLHATSTGKSSGTVRAGFDLLTKQGRDKDKDLERSARRRPNSSSAPESERESGDPQPGVPRSSRSPSLPPAASIGLSHSPGESLAAPLSGEFFAPSPASPEERERPQSMERDTGERDGEGVSLRGERERGPRRKSVQEDRNSSERPYREHHHTHIHVQRERGRRSLGPHLSLERGRPPLPPSQTGGGGGARERSISRPSHARVRSGGVSSVNPHFSRRMQTRGSLLSFAGGSGGAGGGGGGPDAGTASDGGDVLPTRRRTVVSNVTVGLGGSGTQGHGGGQRQTREGNVRMERAKTGALVEIGNSDLFVHPLAYSQPQSGVSSRTASPSQSANIGVPAQGLPPSERNSAPPSGISRRTSA